METDDRLRFVLRKNPMWAEETDSKEVVHDRYKDLALWKEYSELKKQLVWKCARYTPDLKGASDDMYLP